MASLDDAQVKSFVETAWPSIQSSLEEYITIENQSPMFETDAVKAVATTEAVVALFSKWVTAQSVIGLKLEVVRAEGRTPLILIEVPGTGQAAHGTVLMYGHLDKQPPMTGAWGEGLHPYKAVLRDGKLYGRGGADDGYAVFGAVTALAALDAQGVPRSRAVILIEASEESGSPDLPHYVSSLATRIGTPSLIVCLDSGCGNYEQLWITTSLRGLIGGTLRVSILKEAVHSGSSSGVVPSSFRIVRQVLSRIEDQDTGRVLLPQLWAPIPPARSVEALATAVILGKSVYCNFPFLEGAGPVLFDPIALAADHKTLAMRADKPAQTGAAEHADLLLRRTWHPALSVTGADGFPTLESAGNVLRTSTALKLSMRLPPRADAEVAGKAFKEALEANPPCGAHVTYTPEKAASGWDAPKEAPWLTAAIADASAAAFDMPPAYFGEGGSIPFSECDCSAIGASPSAGASAAL